MTETEGLLGVAFHPHFTENRKYYLMHEFMEKNQGSIIIAERVARADLLGIGRLQKIVLQQTGKEFLG